MGVSDTTCWTRNLDWSHDMIILERTHTRLNYPKKTLSFIHLHIFIKSSHEAEKVFSLADVPRHSL